MRRLCILLALLWSAGMAAAQVWTAEVTRDEVFDAGRVSLSGSLINFVCAAKNGPTPALPDSRWWEVSVAPPWQYLIDFSDQLVPVAAHVETVEMTVFLDQTGYRLPLVHRNQIDGGWQVMVTMSDPMLAALNTASRMVLQVGPERAWELPLDGLAAGLETAKAACGATWTAAGQTVQQIPAGPDLRAAAEAYVAGTCNAGFSLGPKAIQMANIDGDGIDDLILDFNDITCTGAASRPNVCGASMCSVDVYLSRVFTQTGRPENLLGMSASVVPLSNGNTAVSTSGNLSMCGSQSACAFLWYWNGAAFTELQQ